MLGMDQNLSLNFFTRNEVGIWSDSYLFGWIRSDSYHSARIRSECVGEGKVLENCVVHFPSSSFSSKRSSLSYSSKGSSSSYSSSIEGFCSSSVEVLRYVSISSCSVC